MIVGISRLGGDVLTICGFRNYHFRVIPILLSSPVLGLYEFKQLIFGRANLYFLSLILFSLYFEPLQPMSRSYDVR